MKGKTGLLAGLAVSIVLASAGCNSIFSPCVECNRPPPLPPPPPWAPINPDELVEFLKVVYQRKDADAMPRVLHPDFEFVLNAAASEGTTSWDADAELRIHRRMFRPEAIPAAGPPLRSELWVVSVDIVLTAITNWEPLPDSTLELVHTFYNATVFFETQGEVDFRVESQQEFVVSIDRTKEHGQAGRFLLYRWVDRGASPAKAPGVARSWTQVKQLYREPVPQAARIRLEGVRPRVPLNPPVISQFTRSGASSTADHASLRQLALERVRRLVRPTGLKSAARRGAS